MGRGRFRFFLCAMVLAVSASAYAAGYREPSFPSRVNGPVLETIEVKLFEKGVDAPYVETIESFFEGGRLRRKADSRGSGSVTGMLENDGGPIVGNGDAARRKAASEDNESVYYVSDSERVLARYSGAELQSETHSRFIDKRWVEMYTEYYDYEDGRRSRAFKKANGVEYEIALYRYDGVGQDFPPVNLVKVFNISEGYDERDYKVWLSEVRLYGDGDILKSVRRMHEEKPSYGDRYEFETLSGQNDALRTETFLFTANGDLELHRTASRDGTALAEYRYVYSYDNSGNWLRKDILLDGNSIEVDTRTIFYGKELTE